MLYEFSMNGEGLYNVHLIDRIIADAMRGYISSALSACYAEERIFRTDNADEL